MRGQRAHVYYGTRALSLLITSRADALSFLTPKTADNASSVKNDFLFVSLFLYLLHPPLPCLLSNSNLTANARTCTNISYSDQSLEVHGIFPRIIILDADDDEEEEEEEEDVEYVVEVECDMELDFNEITFN